MKLRGKKTGTVANFIGYIDQATPIINLPSGNTMLTVRYMDAGVNCYKDYNTIKEFNEDWEDYKPAEPQIADEMAREIIKKWYNKNKIVGRLYSYGGEGWLGLRGGDKDGYDWKIELHVSCNSRLKDDELYSLTELIGEEE